MNFSGYMLFILCFVAFLQIGNSQSPSSILKTANDFFDKKEYRNAAIYYDRSWDKLIKSNKSIYKSGICFFEVNDLDKCIKAFELLSDSKKYRKQSSWYLAKCYQQKRNFRSAIAQYKKYYKTLDKDDLECQNIKNDITRCINGIQWNKKDPIALVEPIGGNINTVEDEYAAFPSIHHPGRYYYSAVTKDNEGGKRNHIGEIDKQEGIIRSDLFKIEENQGIWSAKSEMSTLLNSSRNDILLDFANNGSVIIFLQSWNESEGQILTDTFSNQNKRIQFIPFESPLFGQIGDHSLSLFQDSILIFSSNRIGGFGGYDLYLSVYRNHKWIEPINLGASINTPFNEITPFIAKDGHTLYFSSNNLKSIGGYDIFKTRYQAESGKWLEVENLGIPINSCSDDVHFKLNSDGLNGIFTSDRKDGSKGKRDIFIAYFKEELEEQIYPSYGSVLSNILLPMKAFNPTIDVLNSKSPINTNPSIREYVIESINYNDDNFINDQKNIKILNQLVSMMQIYPETNLEIIGHSYEESPTAINLYFSVKKSIQVADYLVSKNISLGRLKMIGVGNDYPISKIDANGLNNGLANKYNKRIEFKVWLSDTTEVIINYLQPKINASLIYTKPNLFGTLREHLSYSIFLGDAEQVLNHPFFLQKNIKFWVEKNPVNNKFNYYIGNFNDFKSAKKQFDDLSSNKSLTIVPFINGKKIDRKNIIDYVISYPDLISIIKYYNQN